MAILRAPRQPRISIEHLEQVKLVNWVRKMYPVESEYMFAVPNGGARNPVVAQKLKAEGVVAGVPDLMLLCPSRGAHGLAIEMKRPGAKQNALSPAQRAWLSRLDHVGYWAHMAAGFEEAKELIQEYLGCV